MKFKILVTLLMVNFLLVACIDDIDVLKSSKSEQELIAEKLRQNSKLTTFADLFENADLSGTSGKYTVLASTDKDSVSQTARLTNATIKRYILDGNYTLDTLRSLVSVKTLSGEILSVGQVGDTITINGKNLSNQQTVSKSTIYTLSGLLEVEEIEGNEQITMQVNPFTTGSDEKEEDPKLRVMISVRSKDLKINWGDGTIEEFSLESARKNIQHTYAVAGRYNVRITGEEISELNLRSPWEVRKESGRVNANNLSSIDLSLASNLKELECIYFPLLTKLDVSNCEKLEIVSCYSNKLDLINLGNQSNLIYLDCRENQLTEINTQQIPELIYLDLSMNQFSDMDVSKNTKLATLIVSQNRIPSLDISKNIELKNLHCSNNPIPQLELTTLVNLELLSSANCYLTSLDVNKNIKLRSLLCSGNKLEKLDLVTLSKLWTLDCAQNKLTSLNIKSEMLATLVCANNQLTTLDLSTCSRLEKLIAYENKIEEIVPPHTLLASPLWKIKSNLLTKTGLNSLFQNLPEAGNRRPSMEIAGNPGEKTCDRSIAEAKGWTVYINEES